MKKTTLYLPTALKRQLEDAAKRSGRPQADMVRAALERYLAWQDVPAPASIGAGIDEELAGRDTDEWLNGHWRPRRSRSPVRLASLIEW